MTNGYWNPQVATQTLDEELTVPRAANLNKLFRQYLAWLAVLSTLLLAACGGPGGGTPAPAPTTPGIAAGIDVTTLDATTTANVVAKIVGPDNKPISGAKVTFSTDSKYAYLLQLGQSLIADNGNSTATALTDSSGNAVVQLRAGPQAGASTVNVSYDYTITSTTGGASTTATVTASANFTSKGGGALPTTIPSLAVSLDLATLDASSTGNVIAKVLGPDKKPLSGAKVTFTSDSNFGYLSLLNQVLIGTNGVSTATALTDASGNAVVQLKAGAQAGASTVAVRLDYDVATSTGGTTTNSVTVNVNFTSKGGGALPTTTPSITVSVDTPTLDVSSTANVVAKVLGPDKKPLVGVKVSFTTDSNFGYLLQLNTVLVGGNGSSTATALTDASGNAVVQLRAGAQAGASSVTARYDIDAVGGVTPNPSFVAANANFVSNGGGALPANRLDVTISNQNVTGSATVVVAAKLTRSDGGKVGGQKVTFTTDANFGFIIPLQISAGVSSASAITDSNGVATITLSAGSQIGAATVNATIALDGGATTVSGAVNYSSKGGGQAPTSSISLTISKPTVDLTGPVTVTARISRIDGGPVAGQQFRFTTDSNFGLLAPSSDGGTTGVAITDSTGTATIQLAAGPQAGASSVTATFVSVNNTSSNPVLTLPAAVVAYTSGGGGVKTATIRLSIDRTSIDTTTPATVTAIVLGSDGRPIANANIQFKLDSNSNNFGVLIPSADSGITSTALTDVNGVAKILVRAGPQAGADSMTATALFTPGVSSGSAPPPAQVGFSSSGGGTIPVPQTTPVISLSINPATISASTSAQIRASLVGPDGKPLVNQIVRFAINSATTNFGVLVPGGVSGSAITDANGIATIKVLAGVQAGPDIVTATYTGTAGTAQAVNIGFVSSGGGNGTGVQAASVQLLVSTQTLIADGVSTVDLTALVKDANNNALTGQAVQFSSDAGSITVNAGGITDASGQATGKLSTGGDKSTRTIRITATVGTLTSTNTVVVSGTKISVAGVGSLAANGTTQITIRMQDGAGNAIGNQLVNLSSALGNRFLVNGQAITAVTTDSTGQATATYQATKSGFDTVTASALNEKGTLSINVSAEQLTIQALPNQAGVTYQSDGSILVNVASGAALAPGDTSVQLRLTYLKNGAPNPNQTIAFSTTRGSFVGATSVVTDSNGQAVVTLFSPSAGPAVVTAAASAVSVQYPFTFVAQNPTSLVLQTSNATVAPNGSTSITATVRDPQNNLVQGKTVVFTVFDVTGGTLSVAKGITNAFGQTTTTYVAGNASSAKDAVVVTGTVEGTGVSGQVRLTVAGQSLFVRIGTGNQSTEPNSTQFNTPYSVIVTDASGQPIAGATVSWSIQPLYFYKGQYNFFTSLTPPQWVPVRIVSSSYTVVSPDATIPTCNSGDTQLSATQIGQNGAVANSVTCRHFDYFNPTQCLSEDVNNNGILEGGEDTNHNGILDPGIVATPVPQTIITDKTGSGFINIVYPQDRGNWVGIRLIARATVQGTESTASVDFTLPMLASKLTSSSASPPGAISPYGTNSDCTSTQ